MNLDLITAICVGLAGAALGLRQILLSPNNETFPHAAGLVRTVMFVFAACLGGISAIFYQEAEVAGAYAGKAADIFVWLAAGLALYNLVLTGNVLRQRYPAEVQARLRRAEQIVKASCGRARMLQPLVPSPARPEVRRRSF